MTKNSRHPYKVDIAIVGGGLAGLTSAIYLGKKGWNVVVFEKKEFPRHKVCGEYVSNEVLPVLTELGLNPFNHGASHIDEFQLTAPSGKSIQTKLPLGAFGLSRFTLDKMLADAARASGVTVLEHHKVNRVDFQGDQFSVRTGVNEVCSSYVIGAFGKGSHFSRQSSANQKDRGKYVGVKRHVRLNFPAELVALHNFKGGYCGVSNVENETVNICYLAQAKDLQNSGSIEQFERDVLWKNPHLKEVLSKAEEHFERPLAISNFTFGAKKPVENHVLMAGDAAGMISPLCGNGMAMAIASGYELGKMLDSNLQSGDSRAVLEKQYTTWWKSNFRSRLWWGNRLQSLFGRPVVANTALSVLSTWPSITPKIIEKTHGEPSLA